MKRCAALVCCVLAAAATLSQAATKRYRGYTFEAYAVKESGRRITEQRANGRPTLYVRDGDEYSVVLRNPLPVRVGVALSIDGLNSIDGERTKAGDASKWIIEPNSSLTIRGWQTGSSKLRRFVFTHSDDSYADWKEKRDRTDYTRNLGVIGVAWFWSSQELDYVLNPPQPFVTSRDQDYSLRREAESAGAAAKSAPAPACESMRSDDRAGTGMGSNERNDVERVDFEFDTGMYSSGDVLAIYYEFARQRPSPKPFMDKGDDEDGFAPDMHSGSGKQPWWLWK